eukprot:914908-Rhodomonas_salina.4
MHNSFRRLRLRCDSLCRAACAYCTLCIVTLGVLGRRLDSSSQSAYFFLVEMNSSHILAFKSVEPSEVAFAPVSEGEVLWTNEGRMRAGKVARTNCSPVVVPPERVGCVRA